jgi:hypothetical protein
MEDNSGSIADYLEDTINEVDTLRIPDSVVPITEPPISYWTPLRIFIAITGGVILLLVATYIIRAYQKGDYFVKNTFNNDMKFIRHRLGLDTPEKDEIVEKETPPEKPHIVEDLPPTKKNGWCSVGTDRGIRSCVDIGYNETCISQDIYPTRDKCINPNLRYD